MSALVTDPNGIYVDCTFGRGGHSRALLRRLGAGGRLIGIDRDPAAVAAGQELAAHDPRFQIHASAFGDIGEVLATAGVERIAGILLDLGVSSPQLDDPARGFSFSADGPLDMRMNPDTGESAAAWLAHADEGEIATVLRELGEERFARRIARAIVQTRRERALTRTSELAELVTCAVRTREPGKHPATRTFQALRIHVNDELGELRTCLGQICNCLATGGRLVAISFHSLEDRIVKHFIRDESRGPRLPRGVPVMHAETHGRLRPLGRAVKAGTAEIALNPRARSAIMRVAERLP